MKKVFIALGLVFLGLLVSHQGRVAAKSALLLASTFEQAPNLLDTFGKDFEKQTLELGDIYKPEGEGKFGAIVLSYGIAPAGKDDTRLVRLAQNLAKTGIVAFVPVLPGVEERLILPEQETAVVDSVEKLAGLEFVDEKKIGITGFSAGGSIALLAAANERIADKLAFVNVIGSYYDLWELQEAISSQRDDHGQPWEPHPWTVEVYESQLGWLKEQRNPEEIVDSLSPKNNLERIKTRVFLAHDKNDPLIPYTQSRKIFSDLTEAGKEVVFLETTLLKHADPAIRGGKLEAARQLYSFWLYIYKTLLLVA